MKHFAGVVFLTVAVALGAVLVAASGCSNEYVCPDPVGTIIRDDCDVYRTRYESLKMELGLNIGGVGFSVGTGQEKLRDPSELIQVLMQQTMALCRDFNACRVPPADYQRRRQEADRKFTAITAISQQLQGNLDASEKRKLVAKLIEVLSGAAPAPSPDKKPDKSKPKITEGFFRSATGIWFKSKFQPPRPALPKGVPTLAQWSYHGGGLTPGQSTFRFVFWGDTQVDDRFYLAVNGGEARSTAVSVLPGRAEGRAGLTKVPVMLPLSGVLDLFYRPGITGKKHEMGSMPFDAEGLLDRAYLAYQADPIRRDPVEYERPWIVVFSRAPSSARVTMRCKHKGKPLGSVIEVSASHSTRVAVDILRHHLVLPVRIPLKGGTTRGTWSASFPGEKPLQDKFPQEAAGKWSCRISFKSRLARRVAFELKEDGSVQPSRSLRWDDPPWWPIKVQRVDNSVERKEFKGK